MTANQFRAALAHLDLTQVRAARLFGVNERTARRWALGEDIPPIVAAVLRLMVAGKFTVDEFEAAGKRR